MLNIVYFFWAIAWLVKFLGEGMSFEEGTLSVIAFAVVEIARKSKGE